LAARRAPSAPELAALREFHDAELAAFIAAPEAAARLLDVGVAPPPEDADPPRLAALASAASVVLNTPDSYLLR
jgi:hypothetical protein